ncbi:MAG: MMPL family transporter, partial [Planctomycetota bacterium]
FHCVVLIEDHPLFDEELIRESTDALIDCRDHKFEIDPDTNLPMSGNLTAMQRIKADENLQIGTIYTGIIPIVYKAQNQLLKSLTNSIALAFVLIAFVMMVLLRNWQQNLKPENALNISGGLISMLPNVFPIVIVFGAMGHLDIAVDIGSMMTASVAMGVAVDDTIHFLNWYRKGLSLGESRLDSIRLAYKRVATAMTQTTLIGGLGLSAFALSTFTPTQRFGVMMLFMLAAALIGDLILLPAILASPLGKFFGKPAEKPSESQDEQERHSIRVVGDFTDEQNPQAEEDDYPDIHPDSLKHLDDRQQGGSNTA